MGGGNAIVIENQAQWDEHVKAGKKTVGTSVMPPPLTTPKYASGDIPLTLHCEGPAVIPLCGKMALTNRCLPHHVAPQLMSLSV